MKLFVSVVMMGFSLASQAEIVDIGNDEFKALMAQGVKVVDLRTAGEWQQTGVVAGSHLVTLFDEKGGAKPDIWRSEVNAISKPDQPVVLICRTGRRSVPAAKLLNEVSPSRKIYNVKEGLTGWVKAGQSVVPYQQNLKMAGVRCSPSC